MFSADILLQAYRYAPPATRRLGHDWYQLAHLVCTDIAAHYSVSLPKVCAVTSALSPALNWDHNLIWTTRVLDYAQTHKRLYPDLGVDYPGYKTALKKAFLLATDQLPASEESFSPLTAPKTRAFFFNLLNPSDPWPCTIDRHAGCALLGKPASTALAIPAKIYERMADAYRQAASDLHLITCQLQATVWILQRNRWQLTLPF